MGLRQLLCSLRKEHALHQSWENVELGYFLRRGLVMSSDYIMMEVRNQWLKESITYLDKMGDAI